MHLLRFPSCSFHYIGIMFADTYLDRRYNLLNFTLAQSQLTGSAVWWGYSDMPVLDSVTILGVEKPVKSVFVNQASKPFSYHTINKVSFVYVTDSNYFTSQIACKVRYSQISAVHVYQFCILSINPCKWKKFSKKKSHIYSLYTGCNRRNGPDFGRVFLMLNYTEKPQNTYIQS